MYKRISAPDGSRQFHRHWTPLLPQSSAEAELARLRGEFGNIIGTQIFRERIARGEFRP